MKILMLSTVSEFFRQRAGMFLILVGILFGFLSANEHHTFAVFFLTGSYGMFYLFGIWLAFTLLCTQYLIQLWIRPEYVFIYDIRLLPSFKRFIRFFILAAGFLQPLIYYGFYLVIVAATDGFLREIWPVFIFLIILISGISAVAEWRIRNPRLYISREGNTWLKWKLPRPLSWNYWSLEYLSREKGVTLLICKTGAALVFTGTLLYYNTDDYDIRLPGVGLSFGYLLNVGLSYELYYWDNSIWPWARSLPFSDWLRLRRIMMVHSLIILPETLVAVRIGALSFLEIVQLYSLGLALLILFHVWLYKKQGILEETIQPVMIGFVILTLLILYKIPLFVLAVSALILSLFIFSKWYRRA